MKDLIIMVAMSLSILACSKNGVDEILPPEPETPENNGGGGNQGGNPQDSTGVGTDSTQINVPGIDTTEINKPDEPIVEELKFIDSPEFGRLNNAWKKVKVMIPYQEYSTTPYELRLYTSNYQIENKKIINGRVCKVAPLLQRPIFKGRSPIEDKDNVYVYVPKDTKKLYVNCGGDEIKPQEINIEGSEGNYYINIEALRYPIDRTINPDYSAEKKAKSSISTSRINQVSHTLWSMEITEQRGWLREQGFMIIPVVRYKINSSDGSDCWYEYWDFRGNRLCSINNTGNYHISSDELRHYYSEPSFWNKRLIDFDYKEFMEKVNSTEHEPHKGQNEFDITFKVIDTKKWEFLSAYGPEDMILIRQPDPDRWKTRFALRVDLSYYRGFDDLTCIIELHNMADALIYRKIDFDNAIPYTDKDLYSNSKYEYFYTGMAYFRDTDDKECDGPKKSAMIYTCSCTRENGYHWETKVQEISGGGKLSGDYKVDFQVSEDGKYSPILHKYKDGEEFIYTRNTMVENGEMQPKSGVVLDIPLCTFYDWNKATRSFIFKDEDWEFPLSREYYEDWYRWKPDRNYAAIECFDFDYTNPPFYFVYDIPKY